jgi:LacI family transcriptional regulator
LAVDESLVYQGDFTFPSGVAGANHLLAKRQRPTAVFASNDDMALGVLSAAQRMGLQVPAELSIAGFDDSPAASLVWPPLTTVRQPIEEMARVAVDMLVTPAGNGDEPASTERVLPHRLMPRDSTLALSTRKRRAASARG